MRGYLCHQIKKITSCTKYLTAMRKGNRVGKNDYFLFQM